MTFSNIKGNNNIVAGKQLMQQFHDRETIEVQFCDRENQSCNNSPADHESTGVPEYRSLTDTGQYGFPFRGSKLPGRK